jgi:Flp pilus assembly protein TadD
MLCALVAVVYAPVPTFDYINLDDPRAVTDHAQIAEGLSVATISWAFTHVQAPYWHPVTTLSYLFDVSVFGPGPGGHHVMNAVWHLLNTVLIFGLLLRATTARWASFFVAAVFAVHPIHVESVAWIAERKDVLSMFFLLLTIAAYAWWTKHRTWQRYVLMSLAFVLGLLAKPMLVTLPCVLLLLDVWPLERVNTDGGSLRKLLAPWGPRLVEKIPLFVLALVGAAGTMFVQLRMAAVADLAQLPLGHRVANAALSYATYLRKMAWPSDLSVFYPFPHVLPPMSTLMVALTTLALASVFVLVVSRRMVVLLVGWCWYLGTLVPVIGLVQAGSQAMADRFAYIPLLGVYVAIAWGGVALVGQSAGRRRLAAVAATAVVLGLTWLGHRQVLTWNNSVSVWSHAVTIDENNHRAHMNLGDALQQAGRLDDALRQYQRGVTLHPSDAVYRKVLGVALLEAGRTNDAIEELTASLALQPTFAPAHTALGLALMKAGALDRARYHYTESLKVVPNQPDAHNNLGAILASQGKMFEAETHFRAALRLEPNSSRRHTNLGAALLLDEQYDAAIEQFEAALKLDPSNTDARMYLQHAQRLDRDQRFK